MMSRAWLAAAAGIALMLLVAGWYLRRRAEPHAEPPPAATHDAPFAAPSDRAVETTGTAHVGEVQVSGGKVANAQLVSARLEPRFRRCYGRGLAEKPELRGSIVLSVSIDAGGRVEKVEANSDTLAPILSCVRAAVQAAVYAAPEGGAARITIPVDFTSG
ncbi:MAG TPA: AgmX/PglI C-terminal domain-containing protein [Polyangiaceae bacterium]|jgi:hypothetical protein|nr:AgmX/PglI C-terminal domain-containing protein [Polyangiaceae bacterium]